MVRYLLSNSGSAQSLRQHASASMRLGRKFSSFDSDLSTLSGASSLVSSLSVAVAPYGGGTIGASQASHIASSDAASAISALRESGPIARALCKNCSYVFLCAYSPSGPDFCSIDCRTSFDLHTSEEEAAHQQQHQQHHYANGDSYSAHQHHGHQHYHYQQQQQSGVWDESPAFAVADARHHGGGSGRADSRHVSYQTTGGASKYPPPVYPVEYGASASRGGCSYQHGGPRGMEGAVSGGSSLRQEAVQWAHPQQA